MTQPSEVVSTFERYVDRLEASRLATDHGLGRDDLIAVIRRIDAEVSIIEGHGFEVTPFEPAPALAAAAGLGSGVELWVKDETGNVSGSHKARHLFGVALAEAVAPSDSDGAFAIASCGNAALGAAVVARAVDHPLDVFVPVWANEAVVDRIEGLGGTVVRCERDPDVLGDPAHHAMVAAVRDGGIAFSCQGTETPTTIDGGRTIAYEIVDRLVEQDPPGEAHLDRIFVQVGGGALGTSIVTGLAASEGLEKLPVVHVVQPLGNHPLVRAWDRLMAELVGEPAPTTNAERAALAAAFGGCADPVVRDILRRLRESADSYMEPWPDEPVSYATGILDDITYDWIPLIGAIVRSGGFPIVAAEADLELAHRLAHTHTDIEVCPTGAAGLGGLLSSLREVPDLLADRERIAIIFSGHMRPGDPDPLRD